MALTLPSGSQRGRKKQLRPVAVCASTRKASHIGADMNHLWPVSAEAPAPGVLAVELGARGVGAHVGAALLLGHAHAHGHGRLLREGQEAFVVGVLASLGPSRLNSAGFARSAGVTA